MITPINLSTPSKSVNSSSQVNPSFTANTLVQISDNFLNGLKTEKNGAAISSKLLKAIRFFQESGPVIGDSGAILKLTDTAPKERMFFSGSKGLFLNYNDDFHRTINVNEPLLDLQEKLLLLTEELLHKKAGNVAAGVDDVDLNIESIKSLNTIA